MPEDEANASGHIATPDLASWHHRDHLQKEMSQMPKASRDSASQVKDFGIAVDRNEDLGGYTVNFVSIRTGHDLGPMLAGLPGGHCPCPHWGYVVKGQLTVRYGDREEVIGAGEAFYMPPGHVPAATTGSEIVQFSPTGQLQAVEAAMAKAMQQMQGA
jgi:mannose-6-phosphate isomerase-like protein (cupin superfamily)